MGEQTDSVKRLMYIRALDENHAWAVGWSGNFMETTDGGITWGNKDYSISNYDFKSVYSASNQISYASTQVGEILKALMEEKVGRCNQAELQLLYLALMVWMKILFGQLVLAEKF